MLHVINMADFQDAAKTLRRINPHAEAYPEDSLVESMVRHAESLTDGYMSTLGYVLSVFTYAGEFNTDGTPKTGVYVSLNVYGVTQFIDGKR